MNCKQEGTLNYITFNNLEQTDIVKHFFSTRVGGVSEGVFESLNLGFSRGDVRQKVLENFHIITSAANIDCANLVMAHQTHTVNVRRVGKEDRGKGFFRETDYDDVDGLITNEPEVALVTFSADCVPLYFVDTNKKAIGLAHAGWRGTVNGMAHEMLKKMKTAFGTEARDVVCAIGPSIGQCCFQVDAVVTDEFIANWAFAKQYIQHDTVPGKYKVDLWGFNRRLLEEAGVHKENIECTDLCTMCHPALFYSHRHMGNKRGSMAAVLQLKE